MVDYEAWMERAKITVENVIPPGRKFEVKHLFPGHEWEALTVGERKSFGRYFATEVKDGRFPIIERCEEGKSHHNQYIKKDGQQ